MLDFGIAAVGGTSSAFRGGTPRYMAPELERGTEPTPRSDVYAFGIVLRDMLLGLDASSHGCWMSKPTKRTESLG